MLVLAAHIDDSNVEEWDTPLFFDVGFPLAAVGAFVGGFLFPGHSWRWGVAPWWMQFVYMMWRHGPGNIWPIAIVFWALTILFFAGIAKLGSIVFALTRGRAP